MGKCRRIHIVLFILAVASLSLFFLFRRGASVSYESNADVVHHDDMAKQDVSMAGQEEIAAKNTENPCLIVVCYKKQNRKEWGEFISFTPLKEALSETKLKAMKGRGQVPVVVTMRDNNGERLLSYNLIYLGEGEKSTRFRINIAVDTVVTRETFEYGGDEYLTVAHGDNWYMAVARDHDSFK